MFESDVTFRYKQTLTMAVRMVDQIFKIRNGCETITKDHNNYTL